MFTWIKNLFKRKNFVAVMEDKDNGGIYILGVFSSYKRAKSIMINEVANTLNVGRLYEFETDVVYDLDDSGKPVDISRVIDGLIGEAGMYMEDWKRDEDVKG